VGGICYGPVTQSVAFLFWGHDPRGSHLAAVADQEITAFVMWAVAAASFIPVVVVALLAWVKDDAAPAEPGGDTLNPGVRGWGRPARDSPRGASQD
jgi:hypothetical protein